MNIGLQPLHICSPYSSKCQPLLSRRTMHSPEPGLVDPAISRCPPERCFQSLGDPDTLKQVKASHVMHSYIMEIPEWETCQWDTVARQLYNSTHPPSETLEWCWAAQAMHIYSELRPTEFNEIYSKGSNYVYIGLLPLIVITTRPQFPFAKEY